MMIEKEDQNSVSRCSICNQENMAITDPNSGEIICSNCGVVISDKIEDTIHPERRMFTFEGANRNARTGAPPSLARHDMGAFYSYWKGEQRCKWSEDRYSHALTDRKTKNMGFENTHAYFWRQKFYEGFWTT